MAKSVKIFTYMQVIPFNSTPNAESNIRVHQKGEYSYQSKAFTLWC